MLNDLLLTLPSDVLALWSNGFGVYSKSEPHFELGHEMATGTGPPLAVSATFLPGPRGPNPQG